MKALREKLNATIELNGLHYDLKAGAEIVLRAQVLTVKHGDATVAECEIGAFDAYRSIQAYVELAQKLAETEKQLAEAKAQLEALRQQLATEK